MIEVKNVTTFGSCMFSEIKLYEHFVMKNKLGCDAICIKLPLFTINTDYKINALDITTGMDYYVNDCTSVKRVDIKLKYRIMEA